MVRIEEEGIQKITQKQYNRQRERLLEIAKNSDFIIDASDETLNREIGECCNLIFSDTPDVMYPITCSSPVSISVKTISVSQSLTTSTVPNRGCICSDLIGVSLFISVNVCDFWMLV